MSFFCKIVGLWGRCMFSWLLILFLFFPWDLGIWIYFISCVAGCVEWKVVSVSAVVQAW